MSSDDIRLSTNNPRVPRLRLRAAVAAIAGIALALAGIAGAGPESQSPIARKLVRALKAPGVSTARSAAVAIDLATGKTVFHRHQSLSLAPASNEKLAVTYAALVVLGPAYRIRTEVLGEGGQAGTVWRGNLVLKGYGDPTLSSAALGKLAAQLRAAGIRRVTGRILGDESFFDSRRGVAGWRSYFYSNESPPLSALTVDRCVYRGALAPRPALAAAAAFRQALVSAGVKVSGKSREGRAPPGSVPLARMASAPLWKILRFMDRWSDNFTAELVLKQLGAFSGRGTSAGGAALVRRTLAEARVPLAGVHIVDGSGLSTRDRMTSRALASILQKAWANPRLRKQFLSVLAIAGRNGTMRKRLLRPPALGRVFAKTGTTSVASSLAGYVNGRYAFAILHNGYPLASWYAKQAEDRFVTVLAAQ